MEASSKNLVDGLEHLVSICRDGEQGYEKAANNAKDEDLKTIFLRYSQQRSSYVTELQSLITSLGGNPSQSSGATGALHRAWIDIKETLTGHDRHALLESCENGEDAALKAYRDFIGDEFEYRGNAPTSTPFTTTSSTNRNYESTGMDSGNGLDTSSKGFSNANLGVDRDRTGTEYSSGSNMNHSSASGAFENSATGSSMGSSGPGTSGMGASQASGTTSTNQASENVFPVIKRQLQGIQEAHNTIKSLRDSVANS